MPLTPDDICQANSAKSIGLSLRLINDGEKDTQGVMLIEGSPKALMFLADVLRAVANGNRADTFTLMPSGPGNFHFAPSATHGVCIQRTIPDLAE